MCDDRTQVCRTAAEVKLVHDCIGELHALRTSRLSAMVWEDMLSSHSDSQKRGRRAGLLHLRGADLADAGGGGQGLLPLVGILDVREAACRAEKGGVLALSEVRQLVHTLPVLLALRDFLAHPSVLQLCPTVVGLWDKKGGSSLGPAVASAFANVLNHQGQLCAERFPQLAPLRQRVSDVVALLDGTGAQSGALVRGEWEEAERALNLAEHSVLRDLTGAFRRHAGGVVCGVEAAAAVDVLAAREALANVMQASRPCVNGDGAAEVGVVRLLGARHPLLAIRGGTVVPNDLILGEAYPSQASRGWRAGDDDSESHDSGRNWKGGGAREREVSALVVTGPNGGGKTLVLKTIGLCVLMVRYGCWVPSQPGSRVDLFERVSSQAFIHPVRLLTHAMARTRPRTHTHIHTTGERSDRRRSRHPAGPIDLRSPDRAGF